MSILKRWILFALVLCLAAGCFTACAETPTAGETTAQTAPAQATQSVSAETEAAPAEIVDYASRVKLDMSSNTAKQEVTVKMFIDGDTTHFYVPTSVNESGVLKARYLAINTPESTGKIEEWGKKASTFTKEKLSSATSIIIESETNIWDPDSTGDRFLSWVWYITIKLSTFQIIVNALL